MVLNGFFSRFIASVFTVLFCISILELGLRYNGKGPSSIFEGTYEAYKDFYRLKKNVKKKYSYPSYSYNVYTNSYGFRDIKTGERDITNKPFYVFLGASDVFGNGVDYEKTFVGIFSEYASKKGIEIINMAVGGQFFIEQEILFKNFITESKQSPKVVFFVLNDLHIPQFDFRNKNILVIDGNLLDKNHWKSAYVKLLIEANSGAYCYLREKIRKLQFKWTKFLPKYKSPEFIEIYSRTNRMHDPMIVANFEQYFERFEEFCGNYGIIPIYIYLPLSDSFRFNEIIENLGKNPQEYDTDNSEVIIQRYCEKRKVRLVDLKPELRQYYNEGKKLRFDLDAHYNEFANRVIGEYLVKEIFETNAINNRFDFELLN